jgi:hypothetical protein
LRLVRTGLPSGYAPDSESLSGRASAVMYETVRIVTPDEAHARDLANHGLPALSPLVVESDGSWQVEVTVDASQLELLEGLIVRWLRQHGLAEATILDGGSPARVVTAE